MKCRIATISSLFSVVLATAVVGLWAGCKGGTAQGPSSESHNTVMPVLHVTPVLQDPIAADPLSNPLWKGASWSVLGAAPNDTPATPATRVASVYWGEFLYVAFICANGELPAQDSAEVWLDTSAAQNGTDFFLLSANSTGQIGQAWYRSAIPPQPKKDGSPNLNHPISRIPNCTIPGYMVSSGRGTVEGQSVWTAVFRIPLKTLPLPLRTVAKEGTHWRVNLLRTETFQKDGDAGAHEVHQSNFAPVPESCQQLCPYRMAELVIEGANTSFALRTSN